VSQQEVFEESYIPFMIRQVIEGFHSTIFAYGQTGSGKTFTMEGYKYLPNEKGILLPQIAPSDPACQEQFGLV
jgi:Kinesin motor domain